jgi:hypothetical protein
MKMEEIKGMLVTRIKKGNELIHKGETLTL